MARTRITIDYGRCGDGAGVDPRACGLCLRACEPAVFLLHQTAGAVEPDPFDPKAWRVTPMWASLCTRCGECVTVCPQKAIELSIVGFWRTKRLRKNDASPSERDGSGREKDAGSANSSAIGATENTLSRRPVRSGGRGFVLQQPRKRLRKNDAS